MPLLCRSTLCRPACLPTSRLQPSHARTQVGGTTVDHGTYLVPRGTADIFFPTDFSLLCRLYRAAAAVAGGPPERGPDAAGAAHPMVAAEHLGTAEFMLRWAPSAAATRTASGYNPLLEDYSNSAFFLGSCVWPA